MNSRDNWKARLVLLTAFLCLLPPVGFAAADEDEALALLREGRAVLMVRHALAPGVGDPSGFALGDCSTQRNLNDEGRTQASAWGPFLRDHGIEAARVLSSQWCRSLDTAAAMGLGDVEEFPPLNSFFGGRGDREAQTRETINQVNAMGEGAPVILVSHQVNANALTGVRLASNAGVIVRLPLERGQGILAEVAPSID